MKLYRGYSGVITALTCVALTTSCYAQHPSEISRLESEGEHLKALAAYDSMAQRTSTIEATSAAARSAWALGLSDRARLEFDKIALDGASGESERARAFLSKGIIEYQEERYAEAVLYAEKAASILSSPSPLRANVFLLWAESLARQARCGQATDLYARAFGEADPMQKPDISFLRGECELSIGSDKEAKAAFLTVPLRHPRSADSVRRLAQISLAENSAAHAAFWVAKGRDLYPERFTDSWSVYVELLAAIESKDEQSVTAIAERARKRYSPSDPWITLLNAAVEEFAWQQRQGGAGGSSQARPSN